MICNNALFSVKKSRNLPELAAYFFDHLAGSFADCRELLAVNGSLYGWYYLNHPEGGRYVEPGTHHAAYRVERTALAAL